MEVQAKFITWLKRLGYAERTQKGYEIILNQFIAWLSSQGHHNLTTVTKSDLEHYRTYLEQRPNQNTQDTLSGSYIQSHLNIIHLLSKYQLLYNENPLHEEKLITTPFIKKPRTPLTQQEVQSLYTATENNIWGYKERAALALYYGCGLRRSEGIDLKEEHLDYKHNYLEVIKGKGNKNRIIPITPQIKKHLQDYQQYSRPYANPKTNHLLVSTEGCKMNGDVINKRIKKLAAKAQIEKNTTLHVLRHSIATHLLQSGMPLETISQFLGHKDLDTTQIYTHLQAELES